MKILILGGYGVFGGRLAELLSDRADIELLIAGRSLHSAQQFCAQYKGAARVTPVQLDRRDIDEGLRTLAPDVVVDASGPFQHYGDDCYRVVSACIAAKIDYLDLADATEFVNGVAQFDQHAKDAGVFVLSGVSSFPVLTAAVLREIAKEMDIVRVDGGIAPSPYAGVGLNVMRAVISYAGAPVKLKRGGVDSLGLGLAESMRYTVAVPGKLPLNNIHFSLVDVPDLQVLPPEHPTLQDIWMGAGPVPEFLHRILNLLAKTRAALHLPSLAPFSRLFYQVLNAMKYGEHRGGMFMRVQGQRHGKTIEKSWHLLAEGNDGPYIPSMATEAIIRKLFDGIRPAAGARPAIHALELADYDTLFSTRTIFTGFRSNEDHGTLYQHILGTAFDTLPAPVQSFHAQKTDHTWTGKAKVTRGRGVLAKIIAAVFGFPAAGDAVDVSVNVNVTADAEVWTRNFAGKRFSSTQTLGKGKDQYLLVERFGPIPVSLALVVEDGKLFLIPRRWSLFGIPLPRRLLPNGTSFETIKDGQFHFNVEIRAPIIGLIVAYAGLLQPVNPVSR